MYIHMYYVYIIHVYIYIYISHCDHASGFAHIIHGTEESMAYLVSLPAIVPLLQSFLCCVVT